MKVDLKLLSSEAGGANLCDDSYPSRVDHALGSSCGSRGIHNKKRMIEWKLLKLQLRELVTLTTPRCQEIIYENTVVEGREKQAQ